MVLGLITYIVLYLIDPLVDTHTVLGLMIQAGTASVLGLIAYIAVTRWMGLYEAEKIMKTFSKALNFINLG